ncbi:MAG: methyltransferase [Halobacteriovoraceae bacterium]|nr:methyltransferase [Halobacteriovoraceae bacterium]|tara:strand:- start:20733 stop:21371 length:639 start_codon:yes stop_codon:yes gene_type:complete
MRFISEELESYSVAHSTRPLNVADELEQYTREHLPMSQMLIGKMEASLLSFLIKSIQAKRVLEIGTYTGYSALNMAQALPDEGEVITLDINPETTEVAKKYWTQAGVDKKITAIIKPAIDVLPDYAAESFDFIFIDADKKNYLNYFKEALRLVKATGIIVVDNVLWSGKVLKAAEDQDTQAIQELNDYIAQAGHITKTLLPIRDGLFLIKKN